MSRRVYVVIIALGLVVLLLPRSSEPKGQVVTLGVLHQPMTMRLNFDDIPFKEPITVETTMPTATSYPPPPPAPAPEPQPQPDPQPEQPEPDPQPPVRPDPERDPARQEPPPNPTQPTPDPEPVQPTTQELAGGWDALVHCESGGDYGINTGNGYYGAFQFNQQTWDGVVERMGRDDLSGVRASDVSPSDQLAAAQQLYSERGSQPWPECGRHLS